MNSNDSQFLSSIKEVAPDVKIFVVHPGEHKKYFEIFFHSHKVFLNIPGMDLSLNDFDFPEKLRKKLRRTVDIAAGKEPNPIDSYSGKARGISPLFGSFSALYSRAKIGDLIIVPSRGYFEPFLLGEIISEFSATDALAVCSDEYKTPYREVKWLRCDVSKSNISEALANQMSNRKAVIEINEEKNIKEVLGFAYGKYTYKGTSKSYLSGTNYNSKNLTGIIETLTAINLLAQKLNITDDLEIRINFNSPGGIGLISKGRKAIFIAGLFSNCLCGCDYNQTQKDFEDYRDVSEDGILCDPMMQSIDSKTYKEVCEKINEAKQTLNIEVQ